METVMACVVAPLLHRLPIALLLVRTTLPPEQKVVGPPAVIVGVVGVGLTVTLVVALVALHAPAFTVTL